METATDERLIYVDAVVAHEYFHNWTGDRVTCRDWFQLTLKEGLTVLRDQLYTADVTNADEKRIIDAAELERDQFPEDAGPLAHPIQPKSFVEINNFYTPTVYDKGAEVIRMMRTLVGTTAFRKGVDTYFKLFDGKAVTTEDFVHAIEVGSGRDFTQFRRWYHQSGTPEVTASMTYDATRKELTLTLSQRHPNGKYFEADGSAVAPKPVVIPVSVGLLNADGKEMPVSVRVGICSSQSTPTTAILELSKESKTFVFEKVSSPPVLSLLRGYSAPVRLVTQHTSRELALLLAHDTDPYARWHAGQSLFRESVQTLIHQIHSGVAPTVPMDLKTAFATLLKSKLSPGLRALTMEIPPESTFTDQQEISDFSATHTAHTFLRKELAQHCRSSLMEHYRNAYAAGTDSSYAAMGNRRLALQALSYLMTLEEEEVFALCSEYQLKARNIQCKKRLA